MTQGMPFTASAQKAPAEVDPFQQLIADITHDQTRLATKPPTDANAFVQELRGTNLEYIKDAITEVIKLRDWMYEVVSELDERVGEIEEEGDTRLHPEDAEKFKALAQGVDFLIGMIMKLSPNPSAEVSSELAKLRELAADCLTIVAEQTMDAEPDDEEEPENQDPAQQHS